MAEWSNVDNYRSGFMADEYRCIWEINGIEAGIHALVTPRNAVDLNEFLKQHSLEFEIGRKIEYPVKFQLVLSLGPKDSRLYMTAVRVLPSGGMTMSDKNFYAILEVEKGEGTFSIEKRGISTHFHSERGTFRNCLFLDLFDCKDLDLTKILRGKGLHIKLFIRFKIMISWSGDKSKGNNAELVEQAKFLTGIAELNEDNNSDNFYDVTFEISAEGENIRAHRAILAARSPVFRAMFNSAMSEALTGIIKIKDFSFQAMKVMIHYMYTGSLREDWGDVVEELACSAEKYELGGLNDLLNQNIITLVPRFDREYLLQVATTYRNLRKAKKDLEK